VSSHQQFELEGNLIFLTDIEVIEAGHVVCHSRDLWCEAVDRDTARYICFALNKVGVSEVLHGGNQNNRES